MDATTGPDLTTERGSDSQVTWVIGVPGLFLTCYPWLFVQSGTVDVWSTGADFKCLYLRTPTTPFRCKCISMLLDVHLKDREKTTEWTLIEYNEAIL